MSSSRQQQKLNTESILKEMISGTDITISTTSDTMTPIKRDGVNVLEIYYRLDSIRINVRLNSEEQDMYDDLLSEGLVFQKDADPYATKGKFAFFVNESDVHTVLRRLLKLGNGDIQRDSTTDVLGRRDELIKWIKKELNPMPVSVQGEDSKIKICFQDLLICGITLLEEGYQIYNAGSAWKDKTTYHCEEADDGTWYYYLESEDECIAECGRLVRFEAQKGSKKQSNTGKSTLREVVTPELFEDAYICFLDQADANAKSKKSQGSRLPHGLEYGVIDGGNFTQHFGQGAASRTPYLNWHVVSIYYLPENGNIIMGIEVSRYPYINKMKRKRTAQIGNKKTDVAVFYESTRSSLNIKELYNTFMDVSEEVMRLGLG